MASIVREKSIREESTRDDEDALSAPGIQTYPMRDSKKPHVPNIDASAADDGLASPPSKDVLAEMEAFQKEIDQLREKFGQTS